jgi:deoxyribonuclease V
MNIARSHAWPGDWKEAAALQKQLSEQVGESTPATPIRLIAGADISYNRGDKRLFAAVVVLEFPSLKVVESVCHQGTAVLPYRTGFLSFRELPSLLTCFERLESTPDAVLCDGQGKAHPRRFGLACHLGWWLDIPVFGCAKSRLIGDFRPPALERGSTSDLVDPKNREILGKVVRTRTGVAPVFVSIGHAANLEEAVRLTLECSPRYRIPEPTRHAHQLANELRRNADRGLAGT